MKAKCIICGHTYSISRKQGCGGYICQDCEKRLKAEKPVKACNLIYGTSELARVVVLTKI